MFRTVAAAAMIWAAAGAAAWAQTGEVEARALLRAANLDLALAEIAPAMTEDDEGAPAPLPREAIDAAARRHFEAEAMQAEMVAWLRERLAPEDAEAALAWYRSEAGEEISRLEREAMAAPAPDRARRGAVLLSAPEAAPRAEALTRLMEATNVEDAGVAMTLNLAYAMILGMAGSDALPIAPGPRQALAIVKRMEPQVRAQMGPALLAEAGYLYAQVSDDRLEAFTEFAESPAGMRFFAAILNGFETLLGPRAEAFGADMARAGRARDL